MQKRHSTNTLYVYDTYEEKKKYINKWNEKSKNVTLIVGSRTMHVCSKWEDGKYQIQKVNRKKNMYVFAGQCDQPPRKQTKIQGEKTIHTLQLKTQTVQERMRVSAHKTD